MICPKKSRIRHDGRHCHRPCRPKDLASAANEADGAVAIIYNGSISDKTLDIASEAAIETVVGTKEGKGYGKRDDVQSWLVEVHR